MNMYVEEVLGAHFGPLLAYVRKAEHAAKARGLPEGQLPPGFGAAAAEPVIKDFAARWTTAIEALQRCPTSAVFDKLYVKMQHTSRRKRSDKSWSCHSTGTRRN